MNGRVVIIDNGSGLLKAGFAGDEEPRCCILNCVATPKRPRITASGVFEGEMFIGRKAETRKRSLAIRYPIERGIVTNWADMEAIWTYVYSNYELNVSSKDHPVLLTETLFNPRSDREKMTEIFFETFDVPSLFLSPQAVLSLCASGKTTGLVLDVGDGITQAVPVYEGHVMNHSAVISDVAGRDVTQHLQLLLRKEGYRYHTSSDFEMIRILKENACYVASLKNQTRNLEKRRFELPDGSCVEIGQSRYLAPEILFKPEIAGKEDSSVPTALVSSVQRSDINLRPHFYQNIVLSGGSTLFVGFKDRLLDELNDKLPPGVTIKILDPERRLYSTWIGASILTSSIFFKKRWITKSEYEEEGPKAVHKED